MKNIIKGNKGVALIIAYIIIAFLTALSVGFVYASVRELNLARRNRDATKAFWFAEAGLHDVIYQLNDSEFRDSVSTDIDNPTTVSDDFGDGNYYAKVYRDGNDYTITSTGTEVTTGVDRIVRQIASLSPSIVFDYCILTELNLKLENIETGVIGDVHSNGDIENEGVDVTGRATAVGEISGTEYFDDYQEGANEIDMPTLDMEYYKENADYVYTGDWTIGEDDVLGVPYFGSNGIIYVEGNFKAEGAVIIGPGVIVATGTIKMEDGTVVGSEDGMVGLFSSSSDSEEAVKIETDSACYTAVLAPNGGVKIETESSLHGAVVAYLAKIETGSRVEYSDPSEAIPLPGTDLVLSNWEEVF